MACCLCFFSQGSRTWLPLFVIPVFAVLFARFSSSLLLVSISLSLLLILFSTLFIIKQKPNMLQENTKTTLTTSSSDCSEKQDFFTGSQDLYSENENLDQCSTISSEDDHFSDIEFSSQDQHQPDENTEATLISSCELPSSVEAKTDKVEQKNEGFLIRSRDSYSESESLDHCSTTSSEEDNSSDIEWPYNMGQRLDCSDDSISDEESLIEIAIPSGQFVYPAQKDYDPKFNLKRCKLSADINEMNEEDNLIEIDIYMGSIKCSRF